VNWPPELGDPGWFAVFFVLLLLAVLIVLNLASGWWSLVRDYRAEEPALGQRHWFASGRIGVHPLLSVNYGNCLIVTVATGGFRLGLIFPFGVLSPPLFIPWSAVAQLEWRRADLLWHQARVRLHGHWPQIAIWGRAGEGLRDQYSAWQTTQGAAGASASVASWPHA
jgi:hypothetical protein